MLKALDVANYILRCVDREAGDTISALKLQKLVYYAQAWSLVFRSQPLFDENIQAWIHGPVVYSVWERYKIYKHTAIPEPEGDCPSLNDSELEVINEVWRVYGEFSAKRLEALTHSESPWRNARKGVAPQAMSNNIISHEDMKSFYAVFVEED